MSASILVVEDDPVMSQKLSQFLVDQGFAANTARSGAEAMVKIRSEGYDVVITDLVMPGMDGMELLKEIKKFKPSTKVLMITAFGTVPSAVEAIKKGAENYILKPFKLEDIRAALGKILEEAKFKAERTRKPPVQAQDAKDAAIKSVANPTRKKILLYLHGTDRIRFTEIRESLKVDAPLLSFHIRVLKSAGLIEQDPEKKYSLTECGKQMVKMLGLE